MCGEGVNYDESEWVIEWYTKSRGIFTTSSVAVISHLEFVTQQIATRYQTAGWTGGMQRKENQMENNVCQGTTGVEPKAHTHIYNASRKWFQLKLASTNLGEATLA